jgi:hypothetical protein
MLVDATMSESMQKAKLPEPGFERTSTTDEGGPTIDLRGREALYILIRAARRCPMLTT